MQITPLAGINIRKNVNICRIQSEKKVVFHMQGQASKACQTNIKTVLLLL